jgi:hypothetical protein
MITRWSFRRVVIDLHRGATDQSAIVLAGKLAAAMGLELLGRFAPAPGFAELAGLPFAREFRPMEGKWRPLDPERARRELELAETAARRLFERAAGAAAQRFEIATADADGFHPEEDIAVLRYAESLGESCAPVLDEALRSAAAVLIVPSNLRPRRGPVAALVQSAEDPALDIAAALAAAFGETLLRLDVFGHTPMPPDIGLIVVSRQTLPDDALPALATYRRLPVLVVQKPNESEK